MKKFLPLLFCVLTPASMQAAVLISENFDLLPTAVLPASNYAAPYTYQETGGASASGAIVDLGGGSRALQIIGNYSTSTGGYWGAGIGSPFFGVAGSVSNLNEYLYSFTVSGNQSGVVEIRFLAGVAGVAQGGLGKSFNYTGTGAPQSFSGNLGEGGWAPQSYIGNGTSLNLSAPQYQFVLQQSAGPGTNWGPDANNILNLDSINFQSVPEPTSLLVLSGVLAGFAARRRR